MLDKKSNPHSVYIGKLKKFILRPKQDTVQYAHHTKHAQLQIIPIMAMYGLPVIENSGQVHAYTHVAAE